MKILLIEDDPKMAELLKTGLGKEGYSVDTIADGEEGQTRIELYHADYDLVLLDLMLPRKDGLTICRDVREMGITLPILVLTGKDFIDFRVSALDFGADDYLAKPFEFRELMARIRALLRRPKAALSTQLKIGNLVLRPEIRKAYLNSKEIRLTLKEFGILEYMMRHPEKVATRDEILFNIWDFEFDSFSNVVDVHMNNLRKKLHVQPQHDNIVLETVRGVGYRIKMCPAHQTAAYRA